MILAVIHPARTRCGNESTLWCLFLLKTTTFYLYEHVRHLKCALSVKSTKIHPRWQIQAIFGKLSSRSPKQRIILQHLSVTQERDRLF